MGHYTTLNLRLYIKNQPECIEVLKYMVSKERSSQKHPFFQTERWQHLLNQDSCAVAGIETKFEPELFGQDYFLATHVSIKNYGGEIEQFLNWLSAYAYSGSNKHTVVGYIQEEDAESVSLLQIDRGKIVATKFAHDSAEMAFAEWGHLPNTF